MLEKFINLVLRSEIHLGLIRFCRELPFDEFNNSCSTILIIDEIQESPEVYNSIRLLQSELQCHIVVTGSYLGATLNSNYFKPAGNTYELEMLPLSFKEFCKAYNKDELLMNISIYGESKSEGYEKLTQLYKIYREIGGYPAVVNEYKNTQSFERCYDIMRSMLKNLLRSRLLILKMINVE